MAHTSIQKLRERMTPEARRRNRLARLAGCLADSPNFSRNPVELQREMRDEWE